MKKLSVYICTWNVGNSEPISDADFHKLLELKDDNPYDLYAIGLQEIPTGATETAKSFVSYDEWAKALFEFLSQHGYYMIESVRLQGMSLSVFARLSHLPFVRFVKTSYERTGFGGWGNKGGVAVSTWIYGEKICFVNTHLAAHLSNDDDRVENFHQVIEGIDFDDTATIMSHDACFWLGDTNFRIDDITRDDIIHSVDAKKCQKLFECDQLKKHQKKDKLLGEFQEEEITFSPTYKYDVGTSTFDTSEKQRKPAWTDRILLRINPDYLHMISMDLKKEKSQDSSSYIAQVKGSYKSHPQFTTSDHKPVTAVYNLNVGKEQSQLVSVETVGKWEIDEPGFLAVSYSFGMHKDSSDYLALYEWNLTDFRSHITWIYVPESEDPDKITETKICQYEFVSTSDVDPDKLYCVGYYSNKMNCLLALSKPFKFLPSSKNAETPKIEKN
uniref:Inositol polyphosphate 5-phosphatase K-like n=1 Tax=Phallusia mammillata TaxID=59560 RepID=A0A6F9DFF1_9ASCI|nr:inositol polyphosphate 5-phosphatase K-like [Phallusia mammillata]